MTVSPDQLADTLVARERRRRERHAVRAAELRALVANWVEDATRRGLIRRAWLIGSLNSGAWGERSDVDLVVEGLPAEEEARTWSELEALLSVDVDLLRLEELSESFAVRVHQQGSPLA